MVSIEIICYNHEKDDQNFIIMSQSTSTNFSKPSPENTINQIQKSPSIIDPDITIYCFIATSFQYPRHYWFKYTLQVMNWDRCLNKVYWIFPFFSYDIMHRLIISCILHFFARVYYDTNAVSKPQQPEYWDIRFNNVYILHFFLFPLWYNYSTWASRA